MATIPSPPAGPPRCFLMPAPWRRSPSGRTDSPDFSLRWAPKHVGLAVDASGGWRLPVAAAISSQWHDLVRSGLADKDVSAVRIGLG